MDFFAFDDEYVRRLREGDRDTAEHYVHYFKLLLTARLRRRGTPGAEIPDVIQATHIRVFNELRNGKGIRDGHAFGGWVLTVCTHVAQELERKRRETDELDENFRSENDDPLHDVITNETKTRVRRALQSLAAKNERDAAILRDVFLNEGDKDEICRKYGIGRPYLRVLIHRALKAFRGEYDST